MFCAKCGAYTENSEICPQCAAAEANPNTYAGGYVGGGAPMNYAVAPKKPALPKLLKFASLILAILAFFMQFSNLVAERKSEISMSDYKAHLEEKYADEDKEDLSESEVIKEYLKAEKSSLYGDEEYEGELNERRVRYASKFLEWAFLAFALYLGTFFASFYKKNEKIHLIFQGLFFTLMLCTFVCVWFATFTGKSYHVTEYLDLYYTQNVGITFAWIVALISSLAGVVVTALTAKSFNKE